MSEIERIAKALESIAKSLEKMAHPQVTFVQPDSPRMVGSFLREWHVAASSGDARWPRMDRPTALRGYNPNG